MLLRTVCKSLLSCCTQNVITEQTTIMVKYPLRMLCSSTEKDGGIMLSEFRNEKAQEWLDSLSPEMQLKRKKLELELQLLQDIGSFPRYTIEPADIQYILTECKSAKAMEKYLDRKIKNTTTRKNRKEKKKLDAEIHSLPKAVDNDGAFLYAVHNMAQLMRTINFKTVSSLSNYCTPVVFDMDYDMTLKEQVNAVQGMDDVLSFNRTFVEPCGIHITSYSKNLCFLERLEAGMVKSLGLTLHEENFLEIFPRDKLVYITAYGQAFKEHKPGDIYVIPGIVDLRTNYEVTVQKAKSLGVRYGSFPYVRCGLPSKPFKTQFGPGTNLCQSMELVANINLHRDWEYVISEMRKKHVLQDIRDKKYEGFL